MEAIQSFLNTSKLARKQSFKNLTLFPLLAPDATKLDYLILEQTLDRGFSESQSWIRTAASLS